MPTTFPELEPDDYHWSATAFQTRANLANGETQINEPHPALQRVFDVGYSMLEAPEMWQQLVPHFEANKGRTFTLLDFWEIPWVDQKLGTGDGATRIFLVPAKAIQGLVIKVSGVVKTPTFVPDIGPESEGQITFALADTPAAGAPILWSAASARRRFTVLYYSGPNTPPRFDPIPIDGGLWGARFQLLEKITRP